MSFTNLSWRKARSEADFETIRTWGPRCDCGRAATHLRRGETDSFGSEWLTSCEACATAEQSNEDALRSEDVAAYEEWLDLGSPTDLSIPAVHRLFFFRASDSASYHQHTGFSCEFHKAKDGPQIGPALPRNSCDSGDVYHLCGHCNSEKNSVDPDEFDDYPDNDPRYYEEEDGYDDESHEVSTSPRSPYGARSLRSGSYGRATAELYGHDVSVMISARCIYDMLVGLGSSIEEARVKVTYIFHPRAELTYLTEGDDFVAFPAAPTPNNRKA